jgi:hypothetical protein
MGPVAADKAGEQLLRDKGASLALLMMAAAPDLSLTRATICTATVAWVRSKP